MKNRPLYKWMMLITLALPVSVRAQYYSINVDLPTMEAMSEAFATENVMEALHNENIQKIYSSYKAAELASAGIFSSKYLDRKALTNLHLWDDSQENYYYRRIYHIVTRRIIPKSVQCAGLMIKDPATAIYWGSYLMKTCEDVKSLCQQFESVVTNSTLSFSDIPFMEISSELRDVFNLTQLGDVDWKELFEHLGDDIEGTFSKDGLKADLDSLIRKGAGLVETGYRRGMSQLLQGTDLGGTFQEKAESILTLMDHATDMIDNCRNLSTAQLLHTLSGEEEVDRLFDLGDYNLSRWLTDYSNAALGQYYTQRVYIYHTDSGAEQVCSYHPSTDRNALTNGSEWYRINTTDPNYSPSTGEWEAVLSNSESHAGWSRARVRELNGTDAPSTYIFNTIPVSYVLQRNGRQYGMAFAYGITVTKVWNGNQPVHEEVFDSYSMDWDTFMAQMNARLSQYNANGDHLEIANSADLQNYIGDHPAETNNTYYIGYDEKHYYQASDARKVSGSHSATFTLTCHDGGTMGKGSTTYKCDECASSLNEHTRQCSMLTTVESAGGLQEQISSLRSSLNEFHTEASTLQSQIDALNAENSELLRSMSQAASPKESDVYRTAYNANKTRISQLQGQLDRVNAQIRQYQQAIEEAEESERTVTDEYTRIPQLMKAMKDAYGITWTDEGGWSGYTFSRHGTVGSVQGAVTFQATLRIARKPKYFLGIKIHRAIVQIDWELTSSWTDSSVAETIALHPDHTDEENARLVNEKMSELARAYPNCDIRVEYTSSAAPEASDTEGVHHLLWSGDRLEIARAVEARLARIYTDLAMVEKFLHYKHGYKAWFKDILPRLNADRDRRLHIAEQSRRRWMHNGGSSRYEVDDEENE